MIVIGTALAVGPFN
jgi:hypothetical protein